MSDWTAELAETLASMRDESGLSFSAIVGELRDRLGIYGISTAQGVRNYHDPAEIPSKPDVLNVLAMIEIHGRRLGDLPPAVERAVRNALQGYRDLLARNAWSSPHA